MKHPFLRGAIKTCEYEIKDRNINLIFKLEISHILFDLKIHKEIEDFVQSIYGIKYKVNFIDDVDEQALIEAKYLEDKKELDSINRNFKENLQDKVSINEKLIKAKDISTEGNDSKKKKDPLLILGRSSNFKEPIIKISDITPYEGTVALCGEISNIESKELRSGKILLSFDLYDGSSSISCKSFIKGELFNEVLSRLKSSKGIKIYGNSGYSKFSGEIEVIANTIVESGGLNKAIRMDNSEMKRVELHMHTKMSQMDAMTSASDLIKRAMSWGMKSIAITDHGVVQAFPEAHKLLGRDNPNMKIIYGVEAYLAPDKKPSVKNSKGQDIDTTFCVLDLETTGFSPKREKITEIGIMKLQNGKVIDKFSCFINPEKPIPQKVIEVTNITDDMVKKAETIDKVFPKNT